jgi:hypothetical protein
VVQDLGHCPIIGDRINKTRPTEKYENVSCRRTSDLQTRFCSFLVHIPPNFTQRSYGSCKRSKVRGFYGKFFYSWTIISLSQTRESNVRVSLLFRSSCLSRSNKTVIDCHNSPHFDESYNITVSLQRLTM